MGTEAIDVKTGAPSCDMDAPASYMFGGARRDRTADLNTASVALSQLSYGPVTEPDILVRSRRIVYRKVAQHQKHQTG